MLRKKTYTLRSKFLITLLESGHVLSYIVGTPQSITKVWLGAPSGFRTALLQLKRRGVIKLEDKHNTRLIKLTQKGRLEALLTKARLSNPHPKWDGKWRLMMFDIPEASHVIRNRLRSLILENDYKKLQDSVYISPYPLNTNAVSFLKQSGLIDYIRIARIDQLDDDSHLRKKFGLK